MVFQNITTHHFRIRAMEEQDIDRVHEIDQLSFSMPWPLSSYNYELKENLNSLLWVAEEGSVVIGFIVVWLIIDEAHIATIAVHPAYRGNGVAHQLMITAFHEIIRRGINQATLEVRASNQIAQSLYSQFNFEVTGVRSRYYKDNDEDALIMSSHQLSLSASPKLKVERYEKHEEVL